MEAKYVKLSEVVATARNTNDIVCVNCKHLIDQNDENNVYVYQFNGLKGYTAKGKCAYMHKACCEPKRYGRKHVENTTGTPNTTEPRIRKIGLEFEQYSKKWVYSGNHEKAIENFRYCLLNDEAFARVYVSSLLLGSKKTGHGQESTFDSSVTTETTVCNFDLCSGSKWLHNMSDEEIAILADVRCGAHIHVSSNHCGYNETTKAIYEEILKRINKMGAVDRFWYFGRDFSDFCGNYIGNGGHFACTGNDRYGAINIQPDTGCTIEFRLAHVRDAEQFIQCCKWWKATVNYINDNIEKVYNGTWTAERLGKKAANIIDGLYSGRFAKGE